MTGFMLPPVADEPAPRSRSALVVASIAFVVLVVALIKLARPAPFDEASAQSVLPPTETTFTLDISAVNKKDGVNAYALLLPHARNGNPAAQAAIGMIYASGFFGSYLLDYCKGALWIDRSARGGFPYSMALLSSFYKEGSGVKRNPEKAYFWLRQAELGIGPNLDQVLKNRIIKYGEWQRDEKYGFVRF